MALPMLVGGADCGPINPLQGLSKELDRDRGLQQDHFGAGRAGTSKQVFRSQYGPAPGAAQDAARFFSTSPAAGPSSLGTVPYDLSALHSALPPLRAEQNPVQSPPLLAAPPAPWAADFLQQQPPAPTAFTQTFRQDADPSSMQGRQMTHAPGEAAGALNSPFSARTQWTPGTLGYTSNLAPVPYQPYASSSQSQQSAARVDASQWEQAFQSHEEQSSSISAISDAFQEERSEARATEENPDELARAAGSLIDAVRHEQNPKFQNSVFLGLMKQLRDREVVVEGNQMVPKEEAANWAADFQPWGGADVKGKGRAVDFAGQPIISNMLSETSGTQRATLGQPIIDDIVREQLSMPATEEIDEYFRQENDAYIDYWHASAPPESVAPKNAEWDRLQRDWDNFEATATGIRPMSNYQFQANNPYLLGETSRHHMMHSQERNTMYDSVLEMEAAVQRHPSNAHSWFQLGVKQQENEREAKAIQALRRALELDPSHLPSWLALAISHTNEGNRHGSYEAIREWVNHNERYAEAVNAYRQQHPEREGMSQAERFNSMIDCLITMARSDQSGEIDADIQIALAVLMNTNEAYEKAKDCFTTALAVRPDDWQLYNRVGATLANSGRPSEALDYYYRALELNPAYIRARFNLGISCINLRRYNEASQHILDALSLQESDSVTEPDGTEDKRGITSSALWDSLKTCCLHLGRLDLATICDRRDLDAFRLNFNLR